jgi:hypothetical protein
MVMKQPFEQVVEQHGGTVLRVCRVVRRGQEAPVPGGVTIQAALGA